MNFNDFLIYAVYAICFCGFATIIIISVPRRNKHAKQPLPDGVDVNFMKAAQIAEQHGVVNAELLERRLKIGKEDAISLIALLQQNDVIGALNGRGIGKVHN